MAATTATTIERREFVSPTRQRVMGIVFLLLGAGIWLLFGRGTDPEALRYPALLGDEEVRLGLAAFGAEMVRYGV